MPSNLYIDSSGSVVPVDDPQAAALQGWVPASPKQIEDFEIQQKFGTATEAAKAFAEHTASALTFGASDVAEREAGVDPAAMAGREKANPIASGAGTALGIVAPVAATLGAAALPEAAGQTAIQGAKLAAPSLIARAGEALAPKAVTTLGRIGSKAVQYGAEGALYGVQQVVHEAALGDPNLTAQSALATIGMSGLTGGVLGAGSGALGELAGGFSTSDFTAKVRSMLSDAEDNANLNATNAMPGKVKDVLQHKGAGLGRDARDLGIIRNPILDSPDSILERSRGLIKESGEKIGALTAAADATGEAPTFTWANVAGEAEPKILAALRREGSTIGVADQVEAVFGRYAKAYEGRELGLSALHSLRQDLDQEIYKFGKSLDPFQRPTGQPLTRFRGHLTTEIEDGLRAAGQDVKAWRDSNRAVEVGKVFEMLAESGSKRSAANNPLHLSGMIGTAAGLVSGGAPAAVVVGAGSELARRRGASAIGYLSRGLRNLLSESAIEGVVDRTATAIAAERQAGSDTIAQSATQSAEGKAALGLLAKNNDAINSKVDRLVAALTKQSGKVARGEVSAGVSHYFGDSPAVALEEHESHSLRLRHLAGDPAVMQDALQAHSEGLQEHAPQTAQALSITSARALAFLASKLPPTPKPGPLSAPLQPSPSQIATYNRYRDAVENPTGILRQAAAGTLTPEAVEAVRTVYPQLMDKIVAAAMLSAAGKELPYRARLMLYMLAGHDVDGSMTPQAIMANQAIWMRASMKPQGQPQGRAPRSNASKMTTGDRYLTDFQRSGRGER